MCGPSVLFLSIFNGSAAAAAAATAFIRYWHWMKTRNKTSKNPTNMYSVHASKHMQTNVNMTLEPITLNRIVWSNVAM